MNLTPENSYLFLPDLSPVPTHFRALFDNRHIDLWLPEVYKQFGVSVLLLTLSMPLAILAEFLVLLGFPNNVVWRRFLPGAAPAGQ